MVGYVNVAPMLVLAWRGVMLCVTREICVLRRLFVESGSMGCGMRLVMLV